MDKLICELKQRIVDGLHLEDVKADEIDENEPLFVEGLGLDSIDAVELVVIVEKHYGILLKEMETAREAFASIRTLAEFITSRRQTP